MLATGAGFGFAMNKGQVHLPSVIQTQMTFERFTMMKMFVAALGTSVVAKAIFRAVNPAAFEAIQKKRASDPSHAAVLAAGGLILGAGMTLSGSCPGSVYVQLGAGIPSAVPVFLGALVGTLALSLVKPKITQWQQGKSAVDTTISISSLTQAVVGVAILAVAATLEFMLPESTTSPTWLPSAAGVVVGTMQLPLVFVLHKSLHATASYKIVAGRTVDSARQLLGCSLSWLHVPFVADLSTLIFVVGVVAGSGLAGAPSDPSMGATPTSPMALVGGVLLGFGANLASGCTSGHGLSGVALLMKSSMIVLPCIFAGAMSTAFLARFISN
ncbi:Aste57867_9978 [Aphanomyces stellatus]|uniref:Aste57867_9978 protein n=1 Tax=Aphanomyces stellatus TaxID=120398 RepID=A0A485KPU3_9STRA|nr:hypothetical protein As57867_009939 [Aphanomyces stellatus]VFT86856.1 Aste57867_9978 [Aphanomyces stellatus]